MNNLCKFFIVIFGCSLTLLAQGARLANYIGDGKSPGMQLILSTNGPKWDHYAIDYQQIGNIPFSPDPSSQWSTWDVKIWQTIIMAP